MSQYLLDAYKQRLLLPSLTGAPGEGEEAVQRPGPGCYQAPAASQSHSGAADQREGRSEDTTGTPGRQGKATYSHLDCVYVWTGSLSASSSLGLC